MTKRSPLNLNLATRPLRNTRLYAVAVRALLGALAVLAGLTAFAVVKYGGEAARLRSASSAMRDVQSEAQREERRLDADIRKEERLHLTRVNLVNGIIVRKTFRWTALLSEIEQALPGGSYLTSFNPAFTQAGGVTMDMRVTSRGLDDVLAFINNLTARGFKNIQVFGDRRSEDGRTITEMSLSYERAL